MTRPRTWEEYPTPQQRCVAYFVDVCRDDGVEPDKILIGMLAKGVGELLADGNTEEDVRVGIKSMALVYAEDGYPGGSRFARGENSGTYVEDPLGYDRPTYAVPWCRPTVKKILQALGVGRA